jgi:nitrilase
LFGLDLGNERYQEAKLIEPGDKVVVVNSPFGRIGLSICYDLRFPELYRAMPDVDIIVVPSAFTATTGRAHFETLIRARAIENLAYVIARRRRAATICRAARPMATA